MRISIFVKTFLILLVSFSAVFFFTSYITLERFPEAYIEENVNAIRETILEESSSIRNGTMLAETNLLDLSSETSFVLIDNFVFVEAIGPVSLQESELVPFIVGVYGNEDNIVDGDLTYYVHLEDDIYHIDYIYEFELGDYLIISTRFQSLTNIDRVLSSLNLYESIAQLIAITFLSLLISFNISLPLKKINRYATDISNLKFDSSLNIKRNDEFRDLVSSLNEMTYNLKSTYSDLHQANEQLSNTIDYEHQQEQKKQRFIMAINHELKTPLAVMKGMIEGMIDNVGRYQDRDTYLKELLHQIKAIESITNDFTYRLRLEDKMKPGDRVSSTILQSVLETLEPLRQSSKIKLKVSIQEATLLMNEELFVILSTNLIKNAIRYATGSPVEIMGTLEDSVFVLEIRNKGSINEVDLQNIFESFYRADHMKQDTSGSGLGLFIVKEICTLYNIEYKLYNDNKRVVAKIKIPKV